MERLTEAFESQVMLIAELVELLRKREEKRGE
ncbi:MAG TPA: hypothetical protein DEB17_08745 [Chlorobaculum sp.]|uniref:Uncharacterized protein n=1 Tax=Chlorobaculum tepidum (strain ATCC 49652 / DSM 12025 / NBRC 103806 / TLS) TaxID=194439 RepID=Q8KEV8_CHLTE|nr:hypothetical protein CT0574 [Chlorobaculum tepidum TLS]HBU24054.1 hypothetical protein [Chlorobaculum sp.]